jgi:hypothetical protein
MLDFVHPTGYELIPVRSTNDVGTRSNIAVQRRDGTWKLIYCHWDGYLDHNGRILLNHHSSQELAEAVVEPGDMSSLGENSGKPEGHSYDTPVKGYSVYYGRERDEDDVAGSVGASLDELYFEQSCQYVWSREHGAEGGAWYAQGFDGVMFPLAEAIRLGDGVVWYGDEEEEEEEGEA